ncbi:NAD(P)/FAD-dependent oxidoreductase [Fontivita pretiosa]|uniref:NAD(P)/FAD-dependent oxidoreductase n=1 Tax=Fontivita pretiosa TaxID=2989684 RepID=UPI003D184CF1
MNSLHVKYVLVGAGAAGSAAAAAIRQRDPVGSILMVGQETSRPYLRPALSKQFLRRQKTRTELAIDPIGWYDEQKIELRTGRRVMHLDTARHAVTLDSGEEISFDRLLLCTGATPRPLRIPGADLPNVFTLRTIDDADRLHHAIDKAKYEGRPHPGAQPRAAARGRAVVIGSGLLAVEVAASLKQVGLHVELLVGRALPWGKFAGEYTGRFLTRYLESRGVVVHPNIGPDRCEGDGRVQRVLASGGTTPTQLTIECDFVVSAIGITINRELLRGTPIAAEKAILVDEHCQTNVPGIFAAGDCAAVYDPLFGKHRILDHWTSARYTGQVAGANMAGNTAVRYDTVNSFTSEVFDLTLHAWGEPRLVDHRLVRASAGNGNAPADEREFAEIGIAADGRVAQVLAIGRSSEHEVYRQLVARRFDITGKEELIKDPTRDLAALL